MQPLVRFAESWALYAERELKADASAADSAQRPGFSLYDELLIRDKYPSVLRTPRFWTASGTELDSLPVFWDRAIDKVCCSTTALDEAVVFLYEYVLHLCSL